MVFGTFNVFFLIWYQTKMFFIFIFMLSLDNLRFKKVQIWRSGRRKMTSEHSRYDFVKIFCKYRINFNFAVNLYANLAIIDHWSYWFISFNYYFFFGSLYAWCFLWKKLDSILHNIRIYLINEDFRGKEFICHLQLSNNFSDGK